MVETASARSVGDISGMGEEHKLASCDHVVCKERNPNSYITLIVINLIVSVILVMFLVCVIFIVVCFLPNIN